MSLCYDFEKWIMISLVGVAVTLTIGLVTLAYGQETQTPLKMVRKKLEIIGIIINIERLMKE